MQNIDLKEFLFKDKKGINRKLCSFKKMGKNKIHVVLDFDRTLTKGRDQNGERITVWDAIEKFVSREKQLESIMMYKKYKILEERQRLTERQAIRWWGRNLDLYNGIKSSDIKKAAYVVQTRPFVKEFFKICKREDIPTIIISAGIKNVIDYWCEREGIRPSTVISTELSIINGKVSGWKKDTLIHCLNKKEKGHKEVSKIKEMRPNTILIGDSLDDVHMVFGKESVVRIAIYDENQQENGKLEEFISKFDLVLKGDNFEPILKILNLF